MQVTFRYTEEDLRALTRRYPWVRRWETLLCKLLLALLSMAGASILPAFFGFWIGLAFLWTAFGAFLLLALVFVFLRKPTYDLSQLRPITIRLDARFWSISVDVAQSYKDWSALHGVALTADRVFVYVDQWTAFVIPHSAFGSQQEATLFYEFARQNSATAANLAANHPSESWVGQVCRNDQAALRIEYRPDASELLEYEFHQPNPSKPQPFSWFASAAALGITALLIMRLADVTTGQFLLCVAAALFSCFTAIVVYDAWRKRCWRRDLSAHRLESIALEVYADGIQCRTPRTISWCSWQAYQSLRENRQFFVLAGQSGLEDLVVPKRAFESEQHASFFRELVRRHLGEALRAPPVVIPDVSRPVETGNPYQPPQQEP